MGLFGRFRSLFKNERLDVAKRFELLREAVSGTMSNFYMARDRESGDVVGLKISDREKLAHFESRFKGMNKPPEGEIAMQIKHPLIVETYEHGFTTDGLRYIVMEFVEGSGMHQLLHNRDTILEGKRLRLIRMMAESLAVVHACGFIHRDVCPRNFIVSSDATMVKLIDFGLTLPNKKEFRQPGNRTGTPLYMAPEVVRRRSTDERLDIFSFGVTAYHICTYELPWPVSETSGLAAMAHDTATPEDVHHFRPRLNKTLGKMIMKCISANPDKRPSSIDEFLRNIRDVESDDA